MSEKQVVISSPLNDGDVISSRRVEIFRRVVKDSYIHACYRCIFRHFVSCGNYFDCSDSDLPSGYASYFTLN